MSTRTQASTAPAGVVMLGVTAAVLLVVLAPVSWMATRGWVAKTALTAVVEWEVVKSLAAGPVVVVKLVLMAAAREPGVAVRV